VADKPKSDISANCDSNNMLLRFSGFVGPHVLATSDTWHAIADLVWKGMTVPAAVEQLDLDWWTIDRQMTTNIRGYFIDVSMVAGVREEYLGASNHINNQ
jgi:hypothetical protein